MAARPAGAAGEPTGESGIARAAPLEATLEAMRIGGEGMAASPLTPHGSSESSFKLRIAATNDDIDTARCARCSGSACVPGRHAAAMRCLCAAAVLRR